MTGDFSSLACHGIWDFPDVTSFPKIREDMNMQLSYRQGSYPFLNKKFKDFSKTHFPVFKDSIQCKKGPLV